jgi:hypothetical protein
LNVCGWRILRQAAAVGNRLEWERTYYRGKVVLAPGYGLASRSSIAATQLDDQGKLGTDGAVFLMDNGVRTNPTAHVTAREFAAIVKPPRLTGLAAEDFKAMLERAEQRAMALATRLCLRPIDGRLPTYIWAIAFAED